MFNFGDVFDNQIYEQMSKEFSPQPTLSIVQNLAELEQAASGLDIPLDLKSSISEQFKKIWNIFDAIFPSAPKRPVQSLATKNIFGFISQLTDFISNLDFSSPKGALKTLYSKAIQITNNIIRIISTYYQNKTIKIFKYM